MLIKREKTPSKFPYHVLVFEQGVSKINGHRSMRKNKNEGGI